MKKNKKELFDKETMEMFESINKASIEDKKEKKSKIIGNIITVVAIIIFIILFISLIKVNNNTTTDAIDSCMKLGHEYNWCRSKI